MRLSRTDALTLLKESLATLPSELDARADFFMQWRVRTIQGLELAFPDEPAVAATFKNIEFSPRRLTKSETRDAQLKLDAFLSGCVSARAHLEELIRRLLAEPEPMPAPPPAAIEPAAPVVPEPLEIKPPPPPQPRTVYAQPAPAPEPSPIYLRAHLEPEPVVVEPTPAAVESKPVTFAAKPALPELRPAPPEPELATEPVIKGAHMRSQELCAPVRSSLSRVLGAWDRGDRDAALVLSAQLLADLTVLSRDDQFKTAFDGVVSKFVGRDGATGALNSLQAAAPLCVWSMMAAMNEVMKPSPG
jgi:hypothetical protein